MEQVDSYVSPGGTKMRRYKCQCDCGRTITAIGCNIRRGNTLSCGCIKKEVSSNNAQKYFHLNSSRFIDNPNCRKLYMVWYDMIRRCKNESRQSYKYYGGRHIFVCDEWTNSFDAFAEWALNNGYSPELTIDRIDNDGGYIPSNCRWVTQSVQANNKRNNRRLISANGESHTITEWSSIYGVNRHTIAQRIRNGWSVDEAVTRHAR